jgi:hypothetical protein
MALSGVADFCVDDGLDAFPTPGWCDQPTTAMVRGEDAVVTSEVDAGFGYQGSQVNWTTAEAIYTQI